MSSINFDDLFNQADRLRRDAKVNDAVKAYLDIAHIATDEHEIIWRAKALHWAGVAAKNAVQSQTSSYYRDAFNYYRQAEELYLTTADPISLGALYRDMAVTSDYAADYPAALSYFQQSIAKLSNTDSHGELAFTYDKLGHHYYVLGQFEPAKQFMVQALTLFNQEPTSGFYRATTLFDLARVEFKLGQIDQSLKLARESRGWFEAEHPSQSFNRRLAELDGLLAVIYRQLSQLKQAENFFENYQKLLRTFDPLAAGVVESEIQALVS